VSFVRDSRRFLGGGGLTSIRPLSPRRRLAPPRACAPRCAAVTIIGGVTPDQSEDWPSSTSRACTRLRGLLEEAGPLCSTFSFLYAIRDDQ